MNTPFVDRPGRESMGPEHRIVAVVLNYKTPDLALQAAASAAKELDPATDKVLIVDNKSPDDSVPRLRRGIERMSAPHVRLVESPRNGGFAAGNNVGIREEKARAYLLLNSDTIVRPGAAEKLFDTMRGDQTVGICSPRLCFEDDEPQISCFRQHSPLSELIHSAQTGPVRKLLEHWDVPLEVQDDLLDVEWTSFACVLIRREVFETVGLLDEGFFMYYEDADYCRLTRRAGFRIVHNPRARVVHLRGKSSPVKEATRMRKPRPRYYYEARNRFFRRAYGPWGAVVANTMWTLGRGVALPREILGLKQPQVVEKEFFDNWRGSLDAEDSPIRSLLNPFLRGMPRAGASERTREAKETDQR